VSKSEKIISVTTFCYFQERYKKYVHKFVNKIYRALKSCELLYECGNCNHDKIIIVIVVVVIIIVIIIIITTLYTRQHSKQKCYKQSILHA